jgi:hypothetical protein
MAVLTVSPLPGVGFPRRLAAWVRGLFSRRMLLRLAGIPAVQIEGRVIALRPVPLGVARNMVPALIRCARSFTAWDIDETLYDDFVIVLSLGLRLPKKTVESFTVPLWQLAPVVERLAQINGLPTVEAGRADLGKWLAAMTSTGTPSSPGSSPTPAGLGSTSSNA